MTRTSEGPAGMSIETIASLFCGQIRMRITNTVSHNEDAGKADDGHDLHRKSRINLKDHFSSCDILVAGPKYFVNLSSQ